MAKSSPQQSAKRIVNKKARFEFDLFDRVEAGLALKGSEVKSLRAGMASLTEAYARIVAGRVELMGFQIEPYSHATHFNHEAKRPKQLLLHHREIKKLAAKVAIRGFTIIPLAVYFNDKGRAKVELALAKGKSKSDKRHDLRAKDDRRDMQRAMRRRD